MAQTLVGHKIGMPKHGSFLPQFATTAKKSVSCQSGSAAACPSVHAILGFDIFLVLRVLSFMCVETATPYTLL